MVLGKGVDPIIDGIGVRSICPDKSDQTDPLNNFAMFSAPLGVYQLDLLRVDFVNDSIIDNQPSDAFLNKRRNLFPERLRG